MQCKQCLDTLTHRLYQLGIASKMRKQWVPLLGSLPGIHVSQGIQSNSTHYFSDKDVATLRKRVGRSRSGEHDRMELLTRCVRIQLHASSEDRTSLCNVGHATKSKKT